MNLATTFASDLATTPAGRTFIRCSAGMPSSDRTPVEVVDGAQAPQLTGRGYYHTTPSGKTIVRHPNAYKWRTVYHPSTYTIKVGADWAAANAALAA